jgi:hypothetical protein
MACLPETIFQQTYQAAYWLLTGGSSLFVPRTPFSPIKIINNTKEVVSIELAFASG